MRHEFLQFLKNRKRIIQEDQNIDRKRENTFSRQFILIESVQQILSPLQGIPYAICGGHAVAFHGQPRTTDDIDVLVSQSNLQKAVSQFNFISTSPLTIGGIKNNY